jgi:hypothetical protein
MTLAYFRKYSKARLLRFDALPGFLRFDALPGF